MWVTSLQFSHTAGCRLHKNTVKRSSSGPRTGPVGTPQVRCEGLEEALPIAMENVLYFSLISVTGYDGLRWDGICWDSTDRIRWSLWTTADWLTVQTWKLETYWVHIGSGTHRPYVQTVRWCQASHSDFAELVNYMAITPLTVVLGNLTAIKETQWT